MLFTYVNMLDPVVQRMAARGSGVIVNVIGNGGKVAAAHASRGRSGQRGPHAGYGRSGAS